MIRRRQTKARKQPMTVEEMVGWMLIGILLVVATIIGLIAYEVATRPGFRHDLIQSIALLTIGICVATLLRRHLPRQN